MVRFFDAVHSQNPDTRLGFSEDIEFAKVRGRLNIYRSDETVLAPLVRLGLSRGAPDFKPGALPQIPASAFAKIATIPLGQVRSAVPSLQFPPSRPISLFLVSVGLAGTPLYRQADSAGRGLVRSSESVSRVVFRPVGSIESTQSASHHSFSRPSYALPAASRAPTSLSLSLLLALSDARTPISPRLAALDRR